MVDQFGSILSSHPDDIVNMSLDFENRQEMGNDFRSLTQLDIQKKNYSNNVNTLLYQDLKRLSYAQSPVKEIKMQSCLTARRVYKQARMSKNFRQTHSSFDEFETPIRTIPMAQRPHSL